MAKHTMQSGAEFELFTIAVLILSIVAHEVAHGYAANALGDPTAKHAGRLTLNPVPHVDLIGSIIVPGLLVLTNAGILFGWAKPVPYNPNNLKNQRWGEALVGVAGVGTNLALALVFAAVARLAYGFGNSGFAELAIVVVFVNLFLGLFNLIPIPPFDGFTVLRGILPYRFALPLREFQERLAGGGVFSLIIVLFIFVQFFSEPFYEFVFTVFRFLVG
jgi:Zn-dependent protease